MDKKEFFTWLDEDFLARNKGYFPKFRDRWFDKVDHNHSIIRKIFNAEKVQGNFELSPTQASVEMSKIQHLVDPIRKILPEYLNYYGYSEEIFCHPYISNGTHNALKVSKNISSYANSVLAYDEKKKEKIKELDGILSKLGEAWASAKTTKSAVEATISTTHKAFCFLGHYGPDSDSCFRQDSDKTYHKYIIGQTANSFVVTISKFNEDKKRNINVARCIGFYDNDLSIVSTCNYYFSPKFQEGDGIQALKLIIEQAFGTKIVGYYTDRMYLNSGHFHINEKYGNWSFCLEENTPYEHRVDANNLGVDVFYCECCGANVNNENIYSYINEKIVCKRCQ